MHSYNARKGTMVLKDEDPAAAAATSSSCELDVSFKSLIRDPGAQGIASGDYVLVVGKLRQGKASDKADTSGQASDQGGGGSQSGRLGVTAHKVRRRGSCSECRAMHEAFVKRVPPCPSWAT